MTADVKIIHSKTSKHLEVDQVNVIKYSERPSEDLENLGIKTDSLEGKHKWSSHKSEKPEGLVHKPQTSIRTKETPDRSPIRTIHQSWSVYEKSWRHTMRMRRWRQKKGKWTWECWLEEVVVVLVVLTVSCGDKKVPSVRVRKSWNWLTLSNTMMLLALVRLVEAFAENSTAAWNQEPSCLHMSGPPESPWGAEGNVPLEQSYLCRRSADQHKAMLHWVEGKRL